MIIKRPDAQLEEMPFTVTYSSDPGSANTILDLRGWSSVSVQDIVKVLDRLGVDASDYDHVSVYADKDGIVRLLIWEHNA